MSTLYLESSGVLAWLLGQARGREVSSAVDAARAVLTSELTYVEIERALVRAQTQAVLDEGDGRRLRGLLRRVRASWMSMAVSEKVLARAGRPFPVEPVRTLDAIHLATALEFTEGFHDLRVLSLDRRIVENARALGIS